MLRIDFIFCTNTRNTSQNVALLNILVHDKIKRHVSFFVKCYHNIISGKIDIRVPLPPVSVYKYGITARQMLKTSKK